MATIANYLIGPAKRPNIKHDNGFLDKFAPRAPTMEERAKYLLWRGKLEAGEAIQGVPFLPKNDLPDALAAYRYFLDASGKDRIFSAERYIQMDRSGKTTVANVIIEAKNAVFDLYQWKFKGKNKSFQFTGTAIAAGSSSVRFPYPSTENWQKTIGAFQFWISGTVQVNAAPSGPDFDLDFVMHLEDMYNFNPGQKDIVTGIPDSENGIFEITGLAKQYRNMSTVSRSVSWTGKPTAKHVLQSSASRRQRRPADNRRARNRL